MILLAMKGGWHVLCGVNWVDPEGLLGIDDLPEIPQSVANFAAGFGDSLLLGTGQYLREASGASGTIDRCSDAYKYGSWAAFTVGISRIAYAGLIKGASIIASSGLEASAFREGLKNIFRLGVGKGWRSPQLEKYSSDEALRIAAGKSNFGMNLYGSAVAGAGAAGGNGCGCK